MISVVLGFHLCVPRRSLQLTLALVCWCWLGCFLLVSVGELIFDLFLTSSNNLTATVESNAATERKKKSLAAHGFSPRGKQLHVVRTACIGGIDENPVCSIVE